MGFGPACMWRMPRTVYVEDDAHNLHLNVADTISGTVSVPRLTGWTSRTRSAAFSARHSIWPVSWARSGIANAIGYGDDSDDRRDTVVITGCRSAA